MQSEALRGKGSVANGCAGLQTVPASECGKSCAGAKAELGRSDGKWTVCEYAAEEQIKHLGQTLKFVGVKLK